MVHLFSCDLQCTTVHQPSVTLKNIISKKTFPTFFSKRFQHFVSKICSQQVTPQVNLTDLGNFCTERLQVVVVFLFEVLDAAPVGPLGVGVDVHFDHAIVHGFSDILEKHKRNILENTSETSEKKTYLEIISDISDISDSSFFDSESSSSKPCICGSHSGP